MRVALSRIAPEYFEVRHFHVSLYSTREHEMIVRKKFNSLSEAIDCIDAARKLYKDHEFWDEEYAQKWTKQFYKGSLAKQ